MNMLHQFCCLAYCKNKKVFQKEHEIADEYFYEIEGSLGFTHNVSNKSLHYYISFKSEKKVQCKQTIEKT